MSSYLWILVLACLAGAKAQEFDLYDALDSTPAPPKPDVKPPKQGGDDFFDLSDALGPDTPKEPNKPAPAPPKPDPNIPPKSGGGGFSDSDLGDVAGGEYKPEPGRGGGAGGQGGHGGGRASDSGYDSGYDSTGGGAGQSEMGQGPMAGIISAVGVAILGAASSYFAYQKKKLCFKVQGGADPESGRNQSGMHNEPQVLSNLLKLS